MGFLFPPTYSICVPPPIFFFFFYVPAVVMSSEAEWDSGLQGTDRPQAFLEELSFIARVTATLAGVTPRRLTPKPAMRHPAF